MFAKGAWKYILVGATLCQANSFGLTILDKAPYKDLPCATEITLKTLIVYFEVIRSAVLRRGCNVVL